MNSELPTWTHLLAGALIALGERVMPFAQATIPTTEGLRKKLMREVAVVLVNPIWNNWFQIDTPPSRTDLDWAIGTFLRENPTRAEWYRALLSKPTVNIEWREHQPFILPGTVARWEMLANLFDVDALLTFDLVDKRLTDDRLPVHLPGLEDWRTLPWISDHELRRMLSGGVSDLHVHVGGVRIAQALWRDLMEAQRDVRVLRVLAEAYRSDPFHDLTTAGDRAPRVPGTMLKIEIENARSAWQTLVKSSRGIAFPTTPGKRSRDWWTWSHKRLHFERWVLIGAWHQVLHDPRDPDVSPALHTYLGYKHRFFRLLRQPILDGAPGLRYFDDHYFRRAYSAPRRAFTGALGSRLRSSPRRDLAPFADACMYLMESPNVRRIELRFAPWGTPADLVRLLGFWQRFEEKLDKDLRRQKRRPADIRFALHFVRSSKTNPADRDFLTLSRRTASETDRIMRELDMASARLRLALSRPGSEYQRRMKAIGRIDVAGQERDTQLSHFVMHMRLLRGDPEMLDVLEGAAVPNRPHPCKRWLRAWLKVRERHKHIPPLGQPALGMTAHAGEDYAGDILDGAAQIGVAVEYLALRAGDSLGHALALVAPIPDPATAPVRMIGHGARLDSLCWLHEMLEQAGERLGDQLRIRAMIERLGHDIYAKCRTGLDGAHVHARFDDFIWVWKHKMLPQKKELDTAMDIRRAMVNLEYESDALIAQREKPMPLETPLPRLDEAIEVARQTLLDQIRHRRIVVEMNPASNLRISGASQLRHSPAVALARRSRDGLLVCVNTDNPGVLGSRIENEYALLLQGLIEMGESQAEARGILERARQVGRDLVYWPGYRDLTQENEEGLYPIGKD
jgi:hypothetical protein